MQGTDSSFFFGWTKAVERHNRRCEAERMAASLCPAKPKHITATEVMERQREWEYAHRNDRIDPVPWIWPDIRAAMLSRLYKHTALPKELLMPKPFDPTKPCQTKDGRAARVLAIGVNGCNGETLAVLISEKDGTDIPCCHHANGQYMKVLTSARDLVNIPEKKTIYVNIRPNGQDDTTHFSRYDADARATPDRVACVRVEYEEGEGL